MFPFHVEFSGAYIPLYGLQEASELVVKDIASNYTILTRKSKQQREDGAYEIDDRTRALLELAADIFLSPMLPTVEDEEIQRPAQKRRKLLGVWDIISDEVAVPKALSNTVLAWVQLLYVVALRGKVPTDIETALLPQLVQLLDHVKTRPDVESCILRTLAAQVSHTKMASSFWLPLWDLAIRRLSYSTPDIGVAESILALLQGIVEANLVAEVIATTGDAACSGIQEILWKARVFEDTTHTVRPALSFLITFLKRYDLSEDAQGGRRERLVLWVLSIVDKINVHNSPDTKYLSAQPALILASQALLLLCFGSLSVLMEESNKVPAPTFTLSLSTFRPLFPPQVVSSTATRQKAPVRAIPFHQRLKQICLQRLLDVRDSLLATAQKITQLKVSEKMLL